MKDFNVTALKSSNPSGIIPAGHRVLVKPDVYMESYKGVIEIPEDIKGRSQNAQTAGTVISIGSTAYLQKEFGDGKHWCKAGDRVAFARYGGIQLTGKDDETYRIIEDDDIIALLDAEVSFDLENTY